VVVKPAILLGNGFSRGFNEGMFSYSSLLATAEFTERIQRVFKLLDTSDFEAVMAQLETTASLLDAYQHGPSVEEALSVDVGRIRAGLIEAVGKHNPPDRYAVTEQQYDNAGAFLAKFREIYTVNYDTLLYWVHMARLNTQIYKDGFGSSKVLWGYNDQNVHYLHGALHMFYEDGELHKIRSDGASIINEVQARIEDGEYPLYVAEGTPRQKARFIKKDPYLRECLLSLRKNSRPLTIYGFNFNESDAHIVDAIAESPTRELVVTFHRLAGKAQRDRVKDRARRLHERMEDSQGCRVALEFCAADELFNWG
jgi:hypothetical protein